MPRRTKSQQIGSLGERIAAAAFESSGDWIARQQQEDVGIDMELELSDPHPKAHFLKCQIKSFRGKAKPRSLRLNNSFLKYAYECRIPIVLVQVETVSSSVWVCWLQGTIEIKRLQHSIYGSSAYTTIAADWFEALDAPASQRLKSIASGVHPISRATQIRDLVWFGLETHDHDLIGAANSLLYRYHKEVSYFPISLIIDEVLSLGDRIWATLEGNALSGLLYMVARSFGDSFSQEQIQKLVIRGDSYSRTGINALGIMYDEFPAHMGALQLGKFFATHEDWRVAYFCNLRDKFPGVPTATLMTGHYDCALDGYDILPSAREKGLNAWANRGDCAILDFAYEFSVDHRDARSAQPTDR